MTYNSANAILQIMWIGLDEKKKQSEILEEILNSLSKLGGGGGDHV